MPFHTGSGLRCTRYDGTPGAYVQFPNYLDTGERDALTIEAWVFRENSSRTEAIVSHNLKTSFWFGFSGRTLLFYRSGARPVASPADLPDLAWIHVAVSSDGKATSFFINGVQQLEAVTGIDRPHSRAEQSLRLGGDLTGANFHGRLHGVRLWSISRTQREIRASMFQPVRNRPGLLAAFPTGGQFEEDAGVLGLAGPGVMPDRFGILPYDFVIPNGLFPIVLDGEVHEATEYLGAEEVVLRYPDGNQETDALIRLVYRDEPNDQNLYIGVTNVRDVAEDRRGDSWIAIGIDADFSRDGLAGWTDFQIRAPLSGAPASFWLGDGQGGFVRIEEIRPGPGGFFDVAYSYFDEFAPPTMEFRIARSLVGDWSEIDGMVIGHFNEAEAGDDHLVPNVAVAHSPATWAAAAYVQNLTALPVVEIDAYVYDREAGRAVSDYEVRLVDDRSGTSLAAATTQINGEARFSAAVPPDRSLRLEIEERPHHLYLRTQSHGAGIQPVDARPRHVVFAGVSTGTNVLAAVEFYIRQPIGAVALTSYAPTSGVPRLRLRDVPEKLLSEDEATQVTLQGANLHSDMQVFLYSCLDLDRTNGPQELLGCLPNRDYFEARIVARGADESWVRVEVPHVPRPVFNSRWGRDWAWVVKDNWDRPQRAGAVWTRIGGSAQDHFSVRLPPYPSVSGFEFDNEAFGADFDDFEAVFGDDIYRATADTPLGEVELLCLPGPRPEALVFFPVFVFSFAESGGSCVGMSATSLLFHRLALDPERELLNSDDDVSGVHFGNGFTRWRRPAYVSAERAEPPSDCEHQKPRNLPAHIRANHGVQMSKEFLQAVLDQMVGGAFSIEGDPASVLDRVRNNPSGFVVSMVPEIGKGHVVTPYAVVDGVNGDGAPEGGVSVIKVYDNNYPEDTDRFIEIGVGAARSIYRFPRSDNIVDLAPRWDGHWSGQGIYAVPIDIFRERRTLPGLEEALEFTRLLVFGDADGLYTDEAGGEWGWRADGAVVDHLPGARSVTPVGGPNGGTRAVMLFIPTTNALPTVQINIRGTSYSFHAAGGGRWLGVERRDGTPGERDHVAVGAESGRLSSLRYNPQRDATALTAQLLSTPGPRHRVLYEISNLRLDAGRTLEFKVRPDEQGVEIMNDGGASFRPSITVRWIDGRTGNYGANRFESVDVPGGCVQRLIIHDWPLVSKLRSEIVGPGVSQSVEVLSALRAGPTPSCKC